jgi:alkanesulfonate monooxygenase SsuD/methylene tetrahydromethanopterin reductase-like flavin-dependent oxidoreductase (luciferase family)
VDDLRAHGLCGTPDEVVAKLGGFAEAGAGRAYLQVMDLHDFGHLELIAREVLPRCADL